MFHKTEVTTQDFDLAVEAKLQKIISKEGDESDLVALFFVLEIGNCLSSKTSEQKVVVESLNQAKQVLLTLAKDCIAGKQISITGQQVMVVSKALGYVNFVRQITTPKEHQQAHVRCTNLVGNLGYIVNKLSQEN